MKKQQGKIPSVRFSQFKDSWEHKSLNELLSESKKRNESLEYGKDDVLSVSGEYGIVNQIEHLGRSYAGESVHNYHVVQVGDIVYTKSPLKLNPYGIIKLNKGNAGIVSTLYAVYKVNEKTADGSFLDYYFSLDANTNRYLRPLVKKGAKNDMKINNEYVLHDRIFVPSLKEQKLIVTFFDAFCQRIELLKKKRSFLEQYKKGVLKKIFSREIRFRDDNGKVFKDWEKKRLGEVAIRVKMKNSIGSNNVLTISAQHGLISQLDFFNKSVSGKDLSGYYLLSRNDFAYNRSYSNGFPMGAIKRLTNYDEGVVSTLYICFKFKNTVDDTFAEQYFEAGLQNKEIEKVAQEGARNHGLLNIGIDNFFEIELELPSIEEQRKIAKFLTIIDEKISQCIKQIECTESYKKGLLQKMFC